MNRFVLALLALLAGLVTQTAPAHARLQAGPGAEMAVQAPGGSQAAVAARVAGCRPRLEAARCSLAVPGLSPERASEALPVHIGADRARE